MPVFSLNEDRPGIDTENSQPGRNRRQTAETALYFGKTCDMLIVVDTDAIVGSVVVAITTVTGTAIALGVTIQTGHADIRSDVREIRTQMGAMDNRLDGIDRRLTRMQVHLFGSEPETLARP